ncbi:leucine-rich repeats and immunoglobulin-like domains protein 2 [Elysia marginata]|uniref:Leucine-rich repeats and immunoglobulin-like domains protein 2 n=1 Tax=Elysia marginata TaxID=1093978 RepID=A0AAV4ICL0_9GAST|nr:leucine-rich repeats and immunoglobulin-like domains protein 2 [Elysia marginata]
MKLQTTVLVLCVGAHFTATVSSGETCEVRGNSVYDHASRDTIFNGIHPLTDFSSITIRDSKIDPLCPEEWTDLSHAAEIYIGETDLKELPAAGFGNFLCLKSLHITDSLIEVITRKAFPVVTKVSYCYNDGTTTDSKLVFLNLKNNRIHTIEDNSLMAASLKTLYLNNNKIKNIAGKFKFLSGLQSLNLEVNNIESLERSSLQGLTNLESLFLASNAITHISDDAFYHTKLLRSIGLGGLRTLSLQRNKIESLERSSLQGLINLEYLFLVSNAITHISDDAFYYTKRLHTIGLGGNRITSLSWVFRENQLSTVPGDLFMALPGLEKLHLWGNPLQCSDEEWTYLQQKYPGKLYIDDIKCRPSQTVTNKFAENPVSNL